MFIRFKNMFTSGLKDLIWYKDLRICSHQVDKIQDYVSFRVIRYKNMFTSGL